MSFRSMIGISVAYFLITTGVMLGCSGDSNFDAYNSTAAIDYTGYFAVSTQVAQTNTGPGVVSLFNPEGQFVRILTDFYESSEWAGGLVYADDTLFMSIEGSDRVDSYNLQTNTHNTFASHTNLTATYIRQIARDSSGSLYVVESNSRTIEKFDSDGSRVGNPFIPTTTGACSLNDPWGITYITSTDQIAVISRSGGRLSIYDTDGNCIAHRTTAPFNSGGPMSIAYNARYEKLIVTFNTGDDIYSVDLDGTNPTLIYSNAAIIDAPGAVAVDRAGDIYVGSNGTDTVEKLSYDGTTATRALSGPLAGSNTYTVNPTGIVVIE